MYSTLEQGLTGQLRLDCGWTSSLTPVNRWEEIRQFLHFTDMEQIPPDTTDKLARIRPLLDRLHHSFHAAVHAEECHSMDKVVYRSSSTCPRSPRNGDSRCG